VCQREGESVKYFERSWLEGELLPPSSIPRGIPCGATRTRAAVVWAVPGAPWHCGTHFPPRGRREIRSPRAPRALGLARRRGAAGPAPGRAAGGRVMTDHGAHGSVPREPVGGWARGDARNARRLYDPVYRNETHVY
jgi:hypothetical protein